jgi:SAM-dependent methyltransferase
MKLDLGCGKNKREGFLGVDSIKFDGVDIVADLREKWPWDDNSVDEVHCSHFLEHFERLERIHFANELYRVLKHDGKAQIIVPHWGSNRAYGDMTHCWPPVAEMWFYYLDKPWRAGNAPHDDIEYNPKGYNCDFAATWGYSLHQSLLLRNADYQQHALQFWKEAAQDIIATLTARKQLTPPPSLSGA